MGSGTAGWGPVPSWRSLFAARAPRCCGVLPNAVPCRKRTAGDARRRTRSGEKRVCACFQASSLEVPLRPLRLGLLSGAARATPAGVGQHTTRAALCAAEEVRMVPPASRAAAHLLPSPLIDALSCGGSRVVSSLRRAGGAVHGLRPPPHERRAAASCCPTPARRHARVSSETVGGRGRGHVAFHPLARRGCSGVCVLASGVREEHSARVPRAASTALALHHLPAQTF